MTHRTADERIAEELSRHGLRATRQRIAALRRLRRLKSHLTSAELHARLLPEHENLSQKTVYEILDAFVQAGLVSRLTAVGEPYRYEARTPLPRDVSRLRAAVRRSGECGRPDPWQWEGSRGLPRREHRRHDSRRVPALSRRALTPIAALRRHC